VALLFASETPGVDTLVTWAAIATPLRWGPETLARWRRDGRIEIRNMRTGEVLPMYTDLLDELESDHAGRLNPVGAAGRLTTPWLVVHGEEDEAVPVAEGRELARAAGGTVKRVILPHTGHTFGARHPWAGSTPALDQAMETTVDWYVRHLFK
jgi:pimeloyl-ACP methyl ester carboxylesterase